MPAAGVGLRFGGPRPKQFLEIRGRSVLAWVLDALLAAGVRRCVVALPAAALDEGKVLYGDPRVRWTEGGDTRQESVQACLRAAAGADDDLVLVHDGARPLVAPEDVRATVAAAAQHGGALLGRPLGDTLKRLEGSRVVETVERGGLFRAETPQVFRRGDLERALDAARRAAFRGTDEASLVERLGDVPVVTVVARHPNPKVTLPGDLEIVEALLARRHGAGAEWPGMEFDGGEEA